MTGRRRPHRSRRQAEPRKTSPKPSFFTGANGSTCHAAIVCNCLFLCVLRLDVLQERSSLRGELCCLAGGTKEEIEGWPPLKGELNSFRSTFCFFVLSTFSSWSRTISMK